MLANNAVVRRSRPVAALQRHRGHPAPSSPIGTPQSDPRRVAPFPSGRRPRRRQGHAHGHRVGIARRATRLAGGGSLERVGDPASVSTRASHAARRSDAAVEAPRRRKAPAPTIEFAARQAQGGADGHPRPPAHRPSRPGGHRPRAGSEHANCPRTSLLTPQVSNRPTSRRLTACSAEGARHARRRARPSSKAARRTGVRESALHASFQHPIPLRATEPGGAAG